MAPPTNEKDDRVERSSDEEHTAESSEKRNRDVEKGEDSSPERAELNEHPRASRGGSLAALTQRSGHSQRFTDDGKRIIQEEDCWDALGYQWPAWKKWMLLTSIFSVQVSMNFNTSVFPSAVPLVAEEYGVSEQAARVNQMIFLVLYAFGCELWAPWSEEFGRWRILQASLFMINIWQILAALAPNFGALVVARGLGGLSTAGGSVTIGMVADLYQADEQQYAIAYVVLSSVLGTSIGPVVAGPITRFLPLAWNFWVQLIFGVAVQAVHFFMPESRSTIIMDKEAKSRRKNGEDIWGPNEIKNPRVSGKEFMITWARPFEMFFREPIVLSCSLLSGFSDALIFTFQEGFHPVFEKWGFGTLAIAWAFIPINVGYFLAYASYFPWIARDRKMIRENGPNSLPPERRLYWLLYLAPLEFFGLFGFAWTSLGPPQVHWFGPMFFSAMIAVANYAIYMSTIDYMVAAYGVYSASATGGNGFARDFLAGIAALYATPLYTNIGAGSGYEAEYASTILGCLAFVVLIPVYIIYWKGPQIREASKFAQGLADQRKEKDGRRLSEAPREILNRYDEGHTP